MGELIWHIIGGILGIFLATKFVPGVNLKLIPGTSSFLEIEFTAVWQVLILVGAGLGLINFFLKPLLNILTLPLRILTLGLFGLVINMAIIWIVDVLFLELDIQGLFPLFWTTLIVWGVSYFLGLYNTRSKRVKEEIY